MSDNEKTPDEIKTALQRERDRRLGIDSALALWVDVAETTDLRWALTLNVGGTVISGLLCSFDEYVEGVIGEMASDTGQTHDTLKDVLSQLAPEQVDEDDLPDDAGDLTDDQVLERLSKAPRYIHLKDALIVTPRGTLPSNRGIHWRGKLSSVDGWSYGLMRAAQT